MAAQLKPAYHLLTFLIFPFFQLPLYFPFSFYAVLRRTESFFFIFIISSPSLHPFNSVDRDQNTGLLGEESVYSLSPAMQSNDDDDEDVNSGVWRWIIWLCTPRVLPLLVFFWWPSIWPHFQQIIITSMMSLALNSPRHQTSISIQRWGGGGCSSSHRHCYHHQKNKGVLEVIPSLTL